MTVFLKSYEMKKTIKNGKVNKETIETNYDGKKLDIKAVNNNNIEYVSLSNNDIRRLLTLRSSNNSLLHRLNQIKRHTRKSHHGHRHHSHRHVLSGKIKKFHKKTHKTHHKRHHKTHHKRKTQVKNKHHKKRHHRITRRR